MSANEQAEAILIVIKRLLKWALIAALAVVALIASLFGVQYYEQWERNRPRLLTAYADIKLGDSAQQVRYVLGPPPEYLYRTEEEERGKPWTMYPEVVKPEQDPGGKKFAASREWQYETPQRTRIDVEFDKPEGVVVSVSCYSSTVYACPPVFGLRDGAEEDEVLEHLGRPTAETLRDSSKVMRYNDLNLTLYLEKRRVYMVEVTAPSAPAGSSQAGEKGG